MPDTAVSTLALVPYPARVSPAPAVTLTPASRISAPAATREAELLAATISARTGLNLEVTSAEPQAGDVVLELDAADTGTEGYALTTTDGSARITASTTAGLFYGTQTLRQLLTETESGWQIAGAKITDAPRFEYRGAMLDVARHFRTVAEVQRHIDHIASLKLNVLHLHLTDDQGWRLEITAFPKLAELGGATAALGDEGGWYTQQEFRDLIAYAAERHVTIVPEIDTPGHTHAVSVAYPEFVAPHVISESVLEAVKLFDQDEPEFGKPFGGWAVGFSSLKIGDEATNEFVRAVFKEVAALTPGPWVHLGGDEALGTSAEDFATFIRFAAEAVAETGKTPMAWHEAGRVSGLPTGTIGHYWGYVDPQPGYDDAARNFVAGGGRLVLSPADAAYLDMKYSENDALGLTWANGPTSVEASYSWDPANVISGITAADILGVCAPLWSETLRTMADVEHMAFPRVAGIADIAWSPEGAATRTWESVRERIAAQQPAWQAEHIAYFASDEIPWRA